MEPQQGTNAPQALKEASHGTYCDRFGWQGIADLCDVGRWQNFERGAATDAWTRRIFGQENGWTCGAGDLCRGVQCGRCCAEGRPRSGRGAGNFGALAWRWAARDQNGRTRCAQPGRGLVPDEAAPICTRPHNGVAGAQDRLWSTGSAGRDKDEAHKFCEGLASFGGVGPDAARNPGGVLASIAGACRRTRWSNSGSRRTRPLDGGCGQRRDPEGGQGTGGFCQEGPCLHEAHERAWGWSRDGGPICSCHRRCNQVSKCVRGAVVPGPRTRRKLELRPTPGDVHYQSGCTPGPLGIGSSGVVSPEVAQERSNGSLGARGGGSARPPRRHRSPGPKTSRNHVCHLARRLYLRCKARCTADNRGIAAFFDFRDGERGGVGDRLSKGGDRDESRDTSGLGWNDVAGPMATHRRILTPVPLSTNSRLGQSAFWSAALRRTSSATLVTGPLISDGSGRDLFFLTGQSLHSRGSHTKRYAPLRSSVRLRHRADLSAGYLRGTGDGTGSRGAAELGHPRGGASIKLAGGWRACPRDRGRRRDRLRPGWGS
jgi:hypothetical protein